VFSKLDLVFSLLQRDYSVNEGKNLTIFCAGGDRDYPAIWTHNGKNMTSDYNVIIVSIIRWMTIRDFEPRQTLQDENFLMIIDVTSNDAGLYTCSLMKNTSDATESYQDHLQAYLRVKTRPGERANRANKCL
jgi:hypothetical protein